MFVNGDTGNFFAFILMTAVTSRKWRSESWMGLDIIYFAKSFSVFVEFTNRFEAFYNGLTFAEGPYFLHFFKFNYKNKFHKLKMHGAVVKDS
jgi:hypothetical protein